MQNVLHVLQRMRLNTKQKQLIIAKQTKHNISPSSTKLIDQHLVETFKVLQFEMCIKCSGILRKNMLHIYESVLDKSFIYWFQVLFVLCITIQLFFMFHFFATLINETFLVGSYPKLNFYTVFLLNLSNLAITECYLLSQLSFLN